MPRELFSNFKAGMDRRYLETDTNNQAFWLLKNCHISNGNRIQKRGGLALYDGTLDDTTEGLFPFDGKLWVFQAGAAPAVIVQTQVDGPEIWTIVLGHTGTITQVHYVGVLLGGLYISVEFDSGEIAHYYIVTGGDEWVSNKIYEEDPEGMVVYPVGAEDNTNKIVTAPFTYIAEPLRNPRTGTDEPVWPPVGQPDKVDNDYKWRAVKLWQRDSAAVTDGQAIPWHKDGVYIIPEYRKNAGQNWRAWKAINYAEGETLRTSGKALDGIAEGQIWPSDVGDTVVDGDIVWEAIQCPNWSPSQGFQEVDFPIDPDDDEDAKYAHTLTSNLTLYDTIYKGQWEAVRGGANEPDPWPTVADQTVQDGDITWKAVPTQVVDENCPNTAEVLILKSKVYAIGSNIGSVDESDITRYSATNAPFDWTTERDAGFLPTGAQSSGSEVARGLGRYDARLVVMMEDNIEIWNVDEDPEQNSLFQGIGNLGTTYSNSGRGIGTDFVFLSPAGFRSLGSRQADDEFEDTDIGTPVDDPVKEAVAASGSKPVAGLFTSKGQYICAIGTEIWVWTYSRNAKVKAWSVYPINDEVRYFAQLNEKLYIRTKNNNVLVLGDDEFVDHDGEYEFEADFMYQSLQSIGEMKQGMGWDLLCHGECDVSFGYDSNNRSDESLPITVSGNTRSGQTNPLEMLFTDISPRIRYTGPDDLRIDALSIYYEKLGII